MVRFVDLSETCWIDPEENGGPVCAFLNTVDDRFILSSGAHAMFDDEDVDDIDAFYRERCRQLVPDGFWERKRPAPEGEMAVATGEEEA